VGHLLGGPQVGRLAIMGTRTKQIPRTKLDALILAEARLYQLENSVTATREEIKRARDEYEVASDIYLLDSGMDN